MGKGAGKAAMGWDKGYPLLSGPFRANGNPERTIQRPQGAAIVTDHKSPCLGTYWPVRIFLMG